MAQSVVDNVSKILDGGEIVSTDPDFLKHREKEFAKELVASACRMQHFYNLRNHWVEKLADLRAQRAALERKQDMDAFLQD